MTYFWLHCHHHHYVHRSLSGSEPRPLCVSRQFGVLLLAMTALTISPITRWRIGSHTGWRLCYVQGWLLPSAVDRSTKVCYWQVAAGHECCSSSCERHEEVRPQLDTPDLPECCLKHTWILQCSSRKWKWTGMPSWESGAEAGGAWGGGISPVGRGLCPLPGEGTVPPPQKIFWFFVWQWCILGACFNVSIRRVKQESKSSFVCQLPIGQLSHMADVSWKITVNDWSIQKKKTTGMTFPLYKKEREQRSRPTRTLEYYDLSRVQFVRCVYNRVD